MRKPWIICVAVACLALLLSATIALVSPARATFADGPCFPSGSLNVCPSGAVGVSYSAQLLARDGCAPFVSWRIINGAAPPGLSLAASGLISGAPAQAGTFHFWVELQDLVTPQDTWCVPKSYQRELEITVGAGAPATTTSTTLALLPYYWHLTANGTVLHSERAITYADGTTGLGNVLRWEQARKATIRTLAPVTLTHVRASS